MTNYYGLPDFDFVDVDVEKTVKDVQQRVSEGLGKDLYPASPENILALALTDYILQNRVLINDVGKMNLLRTTRGVYMDHLATFIGESRIEAQRAFCTVRFKMSSPLSFVNVIPQKTRVRTQDGRVFETIEPYEIQPGEITKDVIVYAVEPGILGNGVAVGQINITVDVFPYYESVSNITASSGGADREDDEHFREIIHEAPEKFSTAGPDLAYVYWAKKADVNIADVAVWSPEPGVVRIVPLYLSGEIPSEDVLNKVMAEVSPRDRRPLTDKVEVKAPRKVEYDIQVNFWVNDTDRAKTESIRLAVTSAINSFVSWQKSKLGRDINPSELTERIMGAGAKRVEITSPEFKKLSSDQVGHAKSVKINYMGLEEW